MATDTPMQLGMVGLGRMGAGLVRRLMRDGHRCVGYDVFPDAVTALEADGATGATTLEDFVANLEGTRWFKKPVEIATPRLGPTGTTFAKYPMSRVGRAPAA